MCKHMRRVHLLCIVMSLVCVVDMRVLADICSSCLYRYTRYTIGNFTFSCVMLTPRTSRLHAVSTHTYIYRTHTVYACPYTTRLLYVSLLCTVPYVIFLRECIILTTPSSLRGCSATLGAKQHTYISFDLLSVSLWIHHTHIMCIA
jgi:hypothetical protein